MRGLAGTVLVMTLAAVSSPAAAHAQVESDRIAPPSRKAGATRARIVIPAIARSRPGAGRRIWRIRRVTDWSRQEMVLLVLGSAIRKGRQWVRVLLPIRPNGRSGWIPRDHVVLAHTPYWIKVSTTSRTVQVFRRGRRVRRFRAVVGAPGTPTPHGLAAVYERDRQPDAGAFVGSWVLPLTALSNVLQEFGGANGRVGIHGRGGASLSDPLGSARSHGCVRINNGAVNWIAARVPTGTPVKVTRRR